MASSLLELLLHLLLVEAFSLWEPWPLDPQTLKARGQEAQICLGGQWSDGEWVRLLVLGPVYSAYWRHSIV